MTASAAPLCTADLQILADAAEIYRCAVLLESSTTPTAGHGSLLFAQLQLLTAATALRAAAVHFDRYLDSRPVAPPALPGNRSLARRFIARSPYAR